MIQTYFQLDFSTSISHKIISHLRIFSIVHTSTIPIIKGELTWVPCTLGYISYSLRSLFSKMGKVSAPTPPLLDPQTDPVKSLQLPSDHNQPDNSSDDSPHRPGIIYQRTNISLQ